MQGALQPQADSYVAKLFSLLAPPLLKGAHVLARGQIQGDIAAAGRLLSADVLLARAGTMDITAPAHLRFLNLDTSK